MFRFVSQLTKLSSSLFQESQKLEDYKTRLLALAETANHCDRQEAILMACLVKLAYEKDSAVIEYILRNEHFPLRPAYQNVDILTTETLNGNPSNFLWFYSYDRM